MRKLSIVLIAIAVIVVIGANLFIASQDVDQDVPPIVADNTTIRSTTGGDVVGFIDAHGARSWQGIPFAKAPIADLRWRAPRPPSPSPDVLQALAPGSVCPQFTSALSGGDGATGGITGDEDCLFLNVWAPPNASGLPVMYWIHGGGNSIGDGGSYSGAALAMKRDVVVVTINYRLGPLGWFNHPGLATGNPEDDSGNYGTLDAIRGLQWVRDNVGQFGGDPDNVTVFGESAGAFDTLAMMASPLAGGLFHRAIVQSGGFEALPLAVAQAYQDEGGHPFSSREIVAKLLAKDGTVADESAAKDYQTDLTGARLRDYLYGKTPAEIFGVFGSGGFGMISFPYNFGDGHVLPALSTEEIFSRATNHNMVPVILGTNRDEPALFMTRDPRYTENFLGFFPRLKDAETYKSIVKFGADAWKERGVDRLANYMTAAGNPNVYAYRFDWDEEPSQFGFDLSVALGAAHALEIGFVFGDFNNFLEYVYPMDEAQWALSDSMTSYWTEFAYNGDPGQGRDGQEIAWLPWGQDGKRSIILDSPDDQGIYMSDEEVTIASIKQALAAHEFAEERDRCAVYAQNFRDDHFDAAEYEALGDGTCASLDPNDLTGF
jgi:para-nitrobenzyl esterase